MAVPKLVKICINQGVGCATADKKIFETIFNELGDIAGQRPIAKTAKKSISNFKLREGVNIGCMVTLRGDKMYEFFDRLVNIALPRVRDFNGVSKDAFDDGGEADAFADELRVLLDGFDDARADGAEADDADVEFFHGVSP